VSEYRERFILKGGLLVTIWVGDDNRVTRDADFLGFGDGDEVRLKTVFTEIMAIKADDGLVFNLGSGPIKSTFEASKWQRDRSKMRAVRQLFCLQAYFASRSKPFWRPLGFDPFCPWRRWQAWTWNHQALRLPPSPEQNGLKPRRWI
jgi:Nucleotidyl transferase AbiEii toxin, Type IV TA system